MVHEINDDLGFLVKAVNRFAYGRAVSLTKYNQQVYVHINDNSKCWDNGYFEKDKAKSVSFSWNIVQRLKDALNDLDPLVGRIYRELETGEPEAIKEEPGSPVYTARKVEIVVPGSAQEQPGPSHAGPSHAGPSHVGPSHAGPSHAGPSHAGPSHAGPSHTGSRYRPY